MSAVLQKRYISEAEYLKLEESSNIKCEYIKNQDVLEYLQQKAQITETETCQ